MGASDPPPAQPPLAEEDGYRAEIYALLGRLLIGPPSAELLQSLKRLEGGEGAFGEALAALAKAAGKTTGDILKREYNDLFIGLSKGELQPYASFYRAGGLYRRPLADLRADLARLGIARAESTKEPEDHIAVLCESMAALILGIRGVPAQLEEQRLFFESHVSCWAGAFFADLEQAGSARFYRTVGRLGQVFLEIEQEAFSLGD
ncbi:MAG: molecular chaperone [Bacteroidota bacterium]